MSLEYEPASDPLHITVKEGSAAIPCVPATQERLATGVYRTGLITASLGLTDYSQVDTLGVWYKFVNKAVDLKLLFLYYFRA